MARKVLIIAYYFPPLGGAGVQRVLKFAKYLPEHGYEPVIVTTRARDYPAKDASLLEEVSGGTAIIRGSDPRLLRWATRVFDYLNMPRLRALATWPDPATAWIPAATVGALRAVQRHRPAVIFSSAPPFSAHVVAWLTARATGLPWVADFRDEFSANPHAEARTTHIDRLNAAIERIVLADADGVTAVAPYFDLAGAPESSPRRFTIVNGVDHADMAELPADAAPDRFRLSFVGTLHGERDLAPVAAALRRLAEQGVIDRARYELRIVGSMWLARPPDAGPVPVIQTGYLEHRRALVEMRHATVLLFYAPDSSPAPSGKIFEYLACERPILCVARRDNLAYQLVQEWGAGHAVEPGAGGEIESAIADLYQQWQAGTLDGAPDARSKVLARYSRRALTGELAGVFDSTLASPAGRGTGREASRK